MKPLFVEAVGLAAPGLAGWHASLPVLRGERAYVREDLPAYAPGLLPPNERRRATQAVRLAFQVAEEASAASSVAAERLASVFASSDADTLIVHRIGSALAEDSRIVSPTDFHNSVHNAAPGYWSIAARAQLPSNSISACDDSFAAGLIEAWASAEIDGYDQLLVAYDIRPPDLLLSKRAIREPFGVALVLTAARSPRSLAQLQLSASGGPDPTVLTGDLEVLRLANPAARALPLLCALARAEPAQLVLAAGTQRWRLGVVPC